MIQGCLISIACLAFYIVEILVAQWLLGVFGYHFSFFTVFFILLAVDFLVSCLFKKS